MRRNYLDLYKHNVQFKEYVDKLHTSTNYSGYSIPELLELKIVQNVGDYYLERPETVQTVKCDCDLTEDKSC